MGETLPRRRLLGLAGAGAAGIVAAGAAGAGLRGLAGADTTAVNVAVYPAGFLRRPPGRHRHPGAGSPALRRVRRHHLRARANSSTCCGPGPAAAHRMTAGLDAGVIGAVNGSPRRRRTTPARRSACPPARLTLTVGFGAEPVPRRHGEDRFGLADRRPAALARLPRFPGDAIRPELSGGDLCVQACANDPQVAVHAVRNLARIGFGVVSVRWSQLGFGRTSSTIGSPGHPAQPVRLQGRHREPEGRGDRRCCASTCGSRPGDGPSWMAGGSYLVARRIRMMIETWDRTSLARAGGDHRPDQGRRRRAAAGPRSSTSRTSPRSARTACRSSPRTRTSDWHTRASTMARDCCGAATTSSTASDGLGRLDAGLFFMAYQRDPRQQFVPVQRQLASRDTLNEYIRHVSSGLFACPPGVRGSDDFWGRALFS